MKVLNALKALAISIIVICSISYIGSRNAYAQNTVLTVNFTDAVFSVSNSNQLICNEKQLVPGTLGNGFAPHKKVSLSNLNLNPEEGLIEMWIKPEWNGSDGKNHVIWQTNKANGRQLIVEKSELGILRAQLFTPTGMTVARADVSDWKPGEWHHIAVGWISNNGKQVGLPLWIDKVAVDGPITPYGVFDSDNMPNSLILGNEHGNIVYDELLVRTDLKEESPHGMVAYIYRDYFRTAPYDSIKIDPWATRVPSEFRAIAGHEKQFGLQACKQGKWEYVTEYAVRYNQWAYFDAKPFIKWTTSDPDIAQIDSTGRVKTIKPGICTITAEFHKLKASYNLSVISPNKPDLGVICMQLMPIYRNDAVKNQHEVGETVTVHARFGNFGNKEIEAGTKIRFSLIPDEIRNYRLDASEKPEKVIEVVYDKPISAGEETEVTFQYTFPEQSCWMKLELDYDNSISELCETNNTISELCDARPIQMGYRSADLASCLSDQKINHVGSFSLYDWLRAQKQRMDLMLREAVYPTTGPNGVEEAYRIDTYTALKDLKWHDQPYVKKEKYYDGGFPVNENIDLMAIDCAILHEFGHTILSQPDLYGYPMNSNNVFITDDNGDFVADTPVMPVVRGTNILQASGGVNIPCYVGYPYLMDGCQLRLHPAHAGHVMYYKGYRQDRFWGTQGMLIPTRANWLLIKDAYDRPLKNAAVYVYHVSQAPVSDSGAKYFSDRPKFIGQTDEEGRFTFPNQTDENWDDPETDEVDGAIQVWNPFGTKSKMTAFTPNVWSVEGLLLIKIVAGDKTEFHFMDLTQFNAEFLSGNEALGKYTINTSLISPAHQTPIVRKPVPEEISTINKRPVAIAPKKLTVKCGEEFEIDGSKSYDPEGQALIYRWNEEGRWLNKTPPPTPVIKLKSPDKPGKLKYKFWVLDGVRSSEAVNIEINVIE